MSESESSQCAPRATVDVPTEELDYLRGVLERMAAKMVPAAWVCDRLGIDEIIQDALVSVADDFDPTRGTTRAFAKRVFRCKLVDARRRFAREAMHFVPLEEVGVDCSESNSGRGDSVGAGFRRSRRLQAYREAIDSLSPEDRVLLRLFEEETSHEELGRELGKSTGAVRVWKCRVLKELRLRLRAAGYSSSSLFR